MKKLVSLALVLAFLLASAVAVADEKKTINLTLRVTSLYEWEVPASVALVVPEDSSLDNRNTFRMVFKNVRIPSSKDIKLFREAPKGQLVLKDDPSATIEFEVLRKDGSSYYDESETYVHAQAGMETTIEFVVRIFPAVVMKSPAGEYSGSVTYRTEIVDRLRMDE